ncbi:MAG: DoxX family protein [Bacteroidia bacterium]|nr:DoxX family protein [Bacteroidia bacterium]
MKNTFIDNYNLNDWLLLLLRVSLALLMITHGYPKLEKLLSGEEIKFYNFMYLGPKISLILCIIGEFVAPLFVIVGYQTRLAASVSAIGMFVAAFGAHYNDPLSDKEHSLLFAIGFIYIFIAGAGKYSLSKLISNK